VTEARRWQFVRWSVVWMLATVVGLTGLGLLSLESFTVAMATGLIVVLELTSHSLISPGWRRRAGWLVALTLLATAAVLVSRLLTAFPGGVS
jgi:hypothetical protein